MIKNIFLALFFFAHTFTYAQEYEYAHFPTSNAIWYEFWTTGEKNDSWKYQALTITGEDTLVDGLVYKKLFSFSTKVFDPNKAKYIGGIREDDKRKVYFRVLGGVVWFHGGPAGYGSEYGGMFKDEVLLYDFSLSVGDTLKAGNFINKILLFVSSIDTVRIGDSYRKKINVRVKYLEYFYPFEVSWTEGIGYERGLLASYDNLFTIGSYNYLICFEHNNQMLYCDQNPCDCYRFLSVVNETDFKNFLKVYPNPVLEQMLNFDFGELSVKTIEIFNCIGVLAGKYLVSNQQNFSLSTEKYSSGIYFYKIITTANREYKGKFIIP